MIAANPSVASMAPYPLADLAAGIVSLAQNESGFPVSAKAVAAGRAVLEAVPLYPDPDWSFCAPPSPRSMGSMRPPSCAVPARWS